MASRYSDPHPLSAIDAAFEAKMCGINQISSPWVRLPPVDPCANLLKTIMYFKPPASELACVIRLMEQSRSPTGDYVGDLAFDCVVQEERCCIAPSLHWSAAHRSMVDAVAACIGGSMATQVDKDRFYRLLKFMKMKAGL